MKQTKRVLLWFLGLTLFVGALVAIDQNYKRHCRSKGGHTVAAMGGDQVCVDENDKVIRR